MNAEPENSHPKVPAEVMLHPRTSVERLGLATE